ncbi:hypothetical protein BN381_50163 [Candidatus Microthrix parvicella RN1]|uniref:Uncharacterized protein n=1 Tax=Candidatus Neomicrothrix parvicella RN1 TaxID=1229780 RepID=R4Z652_9ACTN|nr:hypothetical protein BN381_50163 [Candidatus Microthrix parvicella RN1]
MQRWRTPARPASDPCPVQRQKSPGGRANRRAGCFRQPGLERAGALADPSEAITAGDQDLRSSRSRHGDSVVPVADLISSRLGEDSLRLAGHHVSTTEEHEPPWD